MRGMERGSDHKLIAHEVVKKRPNPEPDAVPLLNYPESERTGHIDAGQDFSADMSSDRHDTPLLKPLSINAGLVPPEPQSPSKRARFSRALSG
ncbi:MAG: hypothetical protein Q9201_003230 [Fulgogasparrea decipioides]